MKRLIGLFVMGSLLVAAGCRDTSSSNPPKPDLTMTTGCTTECCQDSDCTTAGQVCQNGSCVTPAMCMKDTDCNDKCLSCQNGTCMNNGTCVVDMAMADGPGPMMSVKIGDFYNGNVIDKTKNLSITGTLIGEMNNDGHDKKTGKCKYQAFIQDPAGGNTNAGLRVAYLSSVICAGWNATSLTCNPGMGMSTCPFTPSTMTIADLMGAPTALGQTFTVVGSADIYSPPRPDGGLLPPQHSIDVISISAGTAGPSVNPLVITDLSQFATNGMGYVTNESMLVQLKPGAATAVGTPDMYFNFTYGAATNIPNSGGGIGGNWSFIWDMKKMFPAAGAKFSSITGVAMPAFGGGVAPRQSSDFVM